MKKLALLALVAVAVAMFFALDMERYMTLAALKEGRATFLGWRQEAPWQVTGGYFLLYVAVAALSLPGAEMMTVAAGALFGLFTGTVLVSFASSLGATLAFLLSRFVLRDIVQRRFGDRLRAVNEGMARNGAFYLFTLRMVPLFPFFIVNLLMGLTAIRATTFYWVSQVGMLSATAVYVNAGTQLARVDRLSDIFSFRLLLTFALLGLFPLVTKGVISHVQSRRVYARWSRPRQFDRNLVVIGAGAAGLVTSYIAAAVKAKITLIESHKMGGDCLNFGCVPSKALLRSAKFLKDVRKAKELGVANAGAEPQFPDVMARVHRVIRTIEPQDSVERYTGLGVEVIRGQAKITSPWTVEVNNRTLSTRAIVIATGAAPFVPPLPGLDQVRCYTSDTIWTLTEQPQRLAVLGGGPIGCELSQAFARLGCSVTQIQRGPRILPREDVDAAELVTAALLDDGINLLTNGKATRCEVVDGQQRMIVLRGDEEETIAFDALLLAVGRVPRTTGFGLEELGIPVTARGAVETDAYLQTLYPNIYACGDVTDPYQFTHTAGHQAWYAAVNALFGGVRRFKADYSAIPWTTFTDPEVARVGLSEDEARQRGVAYEVVKYGLDDLDRAIADEVARGFVKVLTVPGKDRILGVTIAGEHAGDLLAEFVLAMRHGLGLNKILSTVHTYPTWSEAAKYAAGEWKRAHTPQRLLSWVERYHAWKRR